MIEDTICAPSTASGGGIGIIRISGADALAILKKVWIPKSESLQKEEEYISHEMIYGHIIEENGQFIDESMAVFMKAPRTYTKEDVVELQCHGGFLSMERTLERVISAGARLAEPGEFTKRAFLNGRIDLSQAEAVASVLDARSTRAHKMAQNHLAGQLGIKITDWREDLLGFVAHIEALLDYPDEMEELSVEDMKENIQAMKVEMMDLIDTFDHGSKLQEGIKTVILGKPNVGKSSFLNVLLREERAIVTDIPGTTRDVIEAPLTLYGLPFILLDTAGLRETLDPIEKEGVKRSYQEADGADLVLLVLDNSQTLDSDDLEALEYIKDLTTIGIINKTDLDDKLDREEVYKYIDKDRVIEVSAKEEKGLDAFKEQIEDLFRKEQLEEDNALLIASRRHKSLLEETVESIDNTVHSIDMGMPEDLLSIDLMKAIDSLGLITGASIEEDVVDRIFEDFCLGK